MTEEIKRVAQESFIKVTATLRLDEVELRALKLLSDYSFSAVVTALQREIVGSQSQTIFEAGIKSLLSMVRDEVTPILKRTDAAREAFKPQVKTP